MKIGIIAHLKHPIRKPFAGGLEAFTYEISRRLTEKGHEVMLFASSASDAGGTLHPILNDCNYDSRTGNRLKQPDMSSEYIAEHHAYYGLMSGIDELNLDIIFNNSLHYVPITMANLVQTPMVTVLHTPPFYELQNAIRAERRHPCIEYITVSRSNALNWNEYLEDCSYVLNGIDLNAWSYHEAGNQENYAVWFGRIHPDKGLDLAIKAARKAGIMLKVAGGIADRRYYKEKIEPLLDSNVQMLGLCGHRELNALIGGAKVCLITPVWQEPFGLVVAEALACGTPVAGFATGALPEVMGADCGVLVAPGDIEALAEAIGRAASLDRKGIRSYAEEHLNIEKMLDAYELHFLNLLSSRSKQAS
ncbi:MAG: glycosyltransferase family 4 protein [Mucilaginibacter sp.]|nr:glycosyltransferase family 4 protein [Mucilaginibacter sp.]